MGRILVINRRVLWATTRTELDKRYAGSILGRSWLILYPLLFLCVYLFLYLVVFRIRLPGFSQLDYVVYIFSGLVPYLAFMEVAGTGAVALRQNIHLVRNVFLPVELIPVRTVGMSLVSEAVGLGVLVAMAGIAGQLGPRLSLLIVAVGLQIMFLTGLALFIAPLGLILPDLAYFTNLIVLFLLFVTPIGFEPEAVPVAARVVVWANPMHYMLAPFRAALLGDRAVDWWELGMAIIIATGTFALGAWLFGRCKNTLVDYE
ncbi:MAG: ABC transporter permease [Acidimicrobiales bacterium]